MSQEQYLLLLGALALGCLLYGWWKSRPRCEQCQTAIWNRYRYCPQCGAPLRYPDVPLLRSEKTRRPRGSLSPSQRQAKPALKPTTAVIRASDKLPRVPLRQESSIVRPGRKGKAINSLRPGVPPRVSLDEPLPPRSSRRWMYRGSGIRSRCPSCQATIEEGDAFCGYCGRALLQPNR